jgi:hypothetical protein
MSEQSPVAQCRPMTLLIGNGDCLEGECDEYATEDGDDSGIDRCSHLTEGLYCAEHSTENEDGHVDPAEPWPCQYAAAIAANQHTDTA